MEWRMRLPWLLLSLLWALVGCSGVPRGIRIDTAGVSPPIVHVPRSEDASGLSALDGDAVKEAVAHLARTLPLIPRPQEAARRLFEVDPRSGSYLFDVRSRRMVPLGPGEHLDAELSREEAELTHAYLRWCVRTGQRGDCLGLLMEGPGFTGDARFTLAMSLAKGAVLDSLWDAVKDTAHPEALMKAALWTATTYALLWAVPEPMTKGVAAVLTAAVILYVGIDTFWGLVHGFRQLMAESDRAVTFDELREAGERFGQLMGRNAARAFVMLATAAIGSTSATLSAKLPGLPGAAYAAVRAEARMGVESAAVGQVEAVALAADGFTVTLAPGAVAMSSRGTTAGTVATRQSGIKAWRSFSGFKSAMGPAGQGKQWHHIVEQTPGNVRRFGPEVIHTTENVIAVDARIHERMSAYFSSKQRIAGGRVVREWLREQSYEKQREFGLQVLKQLGVIP
ncbi:hypothetical protein OV207_31930 [Corallococcus sp. BB11-1]|uniref:SitA5 family polymorphic toxin n=1 Tax=Corallococcus sp. BB11-1 TaxID=2996783 RepID=UPI00226E5627|nr:hypothetical protein [Corallococcus sp. BB11-1]MCY1036087.1 hypothetical protein [Corallococcus sp. BB11-1]